MNKLNFPGGVGKINDLTDCFHFPVQLYLLILISVNPSRNVLFKMKKEFIIPVNCYAVQ